MPHDAFVAHGTDRPNGMPGPASEPVRALSAGRPDIAEQLLTPWQVLFGAGPRLEVFSHGTPGTGPGPTRLAARCARPTRGPTPHR
ncbi:hypothetical protein GCM10018987_52920 [Streptomyces cremeus]